MPSITIATIIEDFSLLESWEDKYSYILDLAQDSPSDSSIHKEDNEIVGCMSQVWLEINKSNDKDPIFTFKADADSFLVKGLVTIILAFYQNQPASWIIKHHPKALFEQLDLSNHLSRQRTNGINALISKIQKEASKAIER